MIQVLDPSPSTPPVQGPTWPDPEQGVIEEARRRQRHRRLGIAAGLGVVLTGAIAAGLTAGLAGSGRRTSPSPGPHPSALLHEGSGSRSQIAISPALDGGKAGWCIRLEMGGSCGALPTHRHPIFAGSTFEAPGNVGYAKLFGPPRGPRETVFTIPSVAYVSLPGGSLVPTRAVGLPYGYRIVTVPGAKYSSVGLLAFDSRRRLVGRLGEETGPGTGPSMLPPRYWQWPQSQPAGPCHIRADGLPGLQPKWGDLASSVTRYRGVVGDAPQSCVDTEYYFHGWPLTAAILLDAAHPGKQPGPLPNATAVAGSTNVFDAPSAVPTNEGLTAVRLPDAWLVVSGGKGQAQRLEVLRHLHATIRL